MDKSSPRNSWLGTTHSLYQLFLTMQALSDYMLLSAETILLNADLLLMAFNKNEFT